MSWSFTDEPDHLRMLRDTLREFVAREMPDERVRAWDKAHHFPAELWQKVAALGVCGLTIDECYGGQGRDLVAAIAVIEELCQAGSFAAGPFIHAAFYGGVNISENGSDAQKEAFLPGIARGQMFFAYGLSEPDIGGDLASVKTRARLSENGEQVVINGTKRWCTGADFADQIICLVNSDPDGKRYRNLSFVLVPPDAEGVTVAPIEHINLRYTASSDVAFDDVVVPAEAILGGPQMWNRGWEVLAGEALEVEKLEISACALGFARACVEEAWRYAEERRQFEVPIGQHQAVRHALVDAKTRLAACRHMLYHAVWLANERRPCSVESSMAKLFLAEAGVEIALTCQRVIGAYGLSDGFNIERNVRDLLGMPIVGGSSNMQRNNIANRLRLAQ
ncbi:MAG: acyl-CoA dehydrogenase family protein [Pseudomonadales bacterium]|nr:acyl-CoA dehydrogenase family protein [Pseudomonadales bacterium]MDP6472790.1 acyl-CoA dehydrogenase family protein [Pseudomonadales bacterium]MDP6972902.1 acyl-CoA dehydrogenase family protein [Pseudomonadales bacterium]